MTDPDPQPLRAAPLLERTAPARASVSSARAARRILLALADGARGGTIELIEPGHLHRAGNGEPVARVTVHDPCAYAAILRAGSVGLGTSYVAGWWDSDDVTTALRVLINWTRPLREHLDRLGRSAGRVLDAVRLASAPGRDDDQRNISAHYDLSNDFFSLMLDETMTYSCAVFKDPSVSLHDAQIEKIDRLCRKLALGPGDRLVEIGSGWGALAIHAATCYHASVTTTTISEAQRAEVVRRVAAAGVDDRVTVLGTDWRDLTGRFDKLVSVEMIEAVDWRLHDRFLAKCADLLVDNGLAALQAIVIDDSSFERAKHHDDFIKAMVFPGGCIPSLTSISASLSRATDLRIIDVDDIGRHYAETLRRWAGNLGEHAMDLDRLGTSRQFRRLWTLYLAYCEAAFLERHISDLQLVLAKGGWRGTLATRTS